jgi:hypothetical protein
MTKFIRYSLAAVWFAASVGCLTLALTATDARYIHRVYHIKSTSLIFHTAGGYAGFAWLERSSAPGSPLDLQIKSEISGGAPLGRYKTHLNESGLRLPLWYPALIFALAGVATLRFRRQFSIRSALIAVSVVAALLGMVVAL